MGKTFSKALMSSNLLPSLVGVVLAGKISGIHGPGDDGEKRGSWGFRNFFTTPFLP